MDKTKSWGVFGEILRKIVLRMKYVLRYMLALLDPCKVWNTLFGILASIDCEEFQRSA